MTLHHNKILNILWEDLSIVNTKYYLFSNISASGTPTQIPACLNLDKNILVNLNPRGSTLHQLTSNCREMGPL